MSAAEIIAAGVLVLILIPIMATDLRERRIPNWLNLALAVAGIGFQAAMAPTRTVLLIALIEPLAVILLFLGLIALMRALKQPGTLGYGDVKFLAAASIWVGFVGSALVFVVASVLALGVTVARAPWRGLDLKAAIPFGPFLAIGLAAIFAASAAVTMEAPAPPVALAAA